jgi:hypothetical protein
MLQVRRVSPLLFSLHLHQTAAVARCGELLIRNGTYLISSHFFRSLFFWDDWLLTNDVFVFCFDEWRHSWRLRSLGLTSRGIKSSLREEEVTASFVRSYYNFSFSFFIIIHFIFFDTFFFSISRGKDWLQSQDSFD